MYKIYRKLPDPFQGDFEFVLKNRYILEDFDQFSGSFPGVSLMMREVSHVCSLLVSEKMIFDGFLPYMGMAAILVM